MAYSLIVQDILKEERRKAGLRDRSGAFNLVAKVAATRKGKRMKIMDVEVGVLGRDPDGKSYTIREASIVAQGPFRLYCSCPAQKFHYKYGNPCKHSLKLLAEGLKMIESGSVQSREISIFSGGAIERALEVPWVKAKVLKLIGG